MNYYDLIEEEAKDFVENFREDLEKLVKDNKGKKKEYILEEVIENEWDLSDKIYEWLDGIWYGFLRNAYFEDCPSELMSCAKIIDESHEVETDRGLWDNEEPQKAIISQAFFTVENDLYFQVKNELENYLEEKIVSKKSL